MGTANLCLMLLNTLQDYMRDSHGNWKRCSDKVAGGTEELFSAWKAHQTIFACSQFLFLMALLNISASCSIKIIQLIVDTTSS